MDVSKLLDKYGDKDWQNIWEDIQNKFKSWNENLPVFGGSKEIISPIPKSLLGSSPQQGEPVGPTGVPVSIMDDATREAQQNVGSGTGIPPKPTAIPTNLPVQNQQPNPSQIMLDYMPYIANQDAVNRKFPNGIPQPNPEIMNLLQQYFPQEATAAAIAILTESGGNPNAQGKNKDGSLDRGLGQINSSTFEDYNSRMPNRIEDMGIKSYQDMFDPAKNLQMMDLIKQYQGWGAWYGPRDSGFDLNRR